MKTIEEKVKEQSEVIDDITIKLKATLMTLENYRYQYDRKEFAQKTGVLESFIETLQAIKIKL